MTGRYAVIDPILLPWAKRHGINVATQDRDWEVRSIWVYDRNGNRRAQMWVDFPDASGNITLHASALDLSSPTKWGPKEVRKITPENLEAALDELRALAFGWAGEGAFT